MRKNSWIALAAVTVLVVIGAVYAVMQRNANTDRGDAIAGYLFPGLLAKVNDVALIAVHDAKHSFTVVRQKDDSWTVPEKSGYPVKPDAVKQTVVGMAVLKALEPRTARPELYGKIGVDEPGKPGSESIQIELKDAAGKALAGLIVGKNKSYEGDTRPANIYVRKLGDAQSWLAEGRFSVKADPIGWFDQEVFKLPRERMMAVEIDQPDGQKLVVSRASHNDKDFALKDLPAGATPKQSEIDGVATGLESLTFDDVAKADSLDFAKATTATFRTFDGLVVTARTIDKEGKHWTTFAAAFDPEQAAKARVAAAAETSAGKDAKPDAKTAEAKTAKAETAKAETAEAKPGVEAEAKGLQASLAGWAYQISDFRSVNFTRKPADLVQSQKDKKPS